MKMRPKICIKFNNFPGMTNSDEVLNYLKWHTCLFRWFIWWSSYDHIGWDRVHLQWFGWFYHPVCKQHQWILLEGAGINSTGWRTAKPKGDKLHCDSSKGRWRPNGKCLSNALRWMNERMKGLDGNITWETTVVFDISTLPTWRIVFIITRVLICWPELLHFMFDFNSLFVGFFIYCFFSFAFYRKNQKRMTNHWMFVE